MIHCNDPSVTIQASKVWWEKGDKISTSTYLDSICSCIYNSKEDNVLNSLQKICSISITIKIG